MAKTDSHVLKEVLKYMEENKIIGKRFSVLPVDKIITINKKGIKHLISRKYGSSDNNNVRLQLVKNLPKILSESHYMGFDPDTKTANVKGVHNFYALTVYQQRIYEVWIKVKETRDLTFVYDMGIIRELK